MERIGQRPSPTVPQTMIILWEGILLRIVIIGAGKLGYSIAELLSKEQYDIVVVDQNETRLETVKDTLDVLTIAANGSSPITMNDADIRGADILIAVTASDEVNMISCILAKKHGIKHTIARIRDMQFMSEAKEYLKSNFDIDLMLNPELITALEINRILMMPAALNVEDFAEGKVRLFETKVRRHSPLAQVPFKDLDMPKSILAGMIFRDHHMIIPHGDDSLQPHDNAYFIGNPKDIEKFSKNFVQRDARKLRRAIIIGAGRTGRFLAPMLDKQGVKVKIFDKNRDRCRLAAARLENGIAICGHRPPNARTAAAAGLPSAQSSGNTRASAVVSTFTPGDNLATKSSTSASTAPTAASSVGRNSQTTSQRSGTMLMALPPAILPMLMVVAVRSACPPKPASAATNAAAGSIALAPRLGSLEWAARPWKTLR